MIPKAPPEEKTPQRSTFTFLYTPATQLSADKTNNTPNNANNSGDIKMRKTLIIGMTALSLTLGGLGVAVAGGKMGHDGPMDGRMIDRLAHKLDLTDAQMDQVDEMMAGEFKDMRQQMRTMKDLRQDLRQLDPNAADYQQQVDTLAAQIAANTEQMVKMRAEQKQAFNEILTPDQRTELAELKDSWRERMHNRFGGEHGGKGRYCRD